MVSTYLFLSSISFQSLLYTNKSLHLHHILSVPHITKYFLSFSQFAQHNNAFFENPFHCFVKDPQTREIMFKGQIQNGLYVFNLNLAQSSIINNLPRLNIHLLIHSLPIKL